MFNIASMCKKVNSFFFANSFLLKSIKNVATQKSEFTNIEFHEPDHFILYGCIRLLKTVSL